MPYIYYLLYIHNNKVWTLFDNINKVNAMRLDYGQELDFKIWKTNIETHKIDGSILETFGLIIADFQIKNKVNKPQYFSKTFFMVNTKVEVILKITF